MGTKRVASEEQLGSLIAGGPFDGSKLHDGRVDLRNLVFRSPTPVTARQVDPRYKIPIRAIELSRVHFDRVDFAGCDMRDFEVTACSFSDCVFDGANCSGWRTWKTKFANCSFVRSNLKEACIGTLSLDGSRNEFTDVVFAGTKLNHLICTAGVFKSCRFRECDFRGAGFGASEFHDCEFSGLMEDMAFGDGVSLPNDLLPLYATIPTGLVRGCTFENTVFRDVEFIDVLLERVTWPPTQENVIVGNLWEAMDEAIAVSHRLKDERMAEYFRGARRARGRGVGIVHKGELINLFGSDHANAVLAVFERFECRK